MTTPQPPADPSLDEIARGSLAAIANAVYINTIVGDSVAVGLIRGAIRTAVTRHEEMLVSCEQQNHNQAQLLDLQSDQLIALEAERDKLRTRLGTCGESGRDKIDTLTEMQAIHVEELNRQREALEGIRECFQGALGLSKDQVLESVELLVGKTGGNHE